MSLTKDQIRAALDMPVEELEVPRWGGTVWVRAMPLASAAFVGFRNRPLDKQGTPPSPEEYRVRTMIGAAILSTLDGPEGDRIFDWKDADWLREKHWLTVLDIATKAFDLAGAGDDEEAPDDADTTDDGEVAAVEAQIVSPAPTGPPDGPSAPPEGATPDPLAPTSDF